MSNDQVEQLSIRQLLKGDVDYLIPMYQRNYAWDEAEITQLIQDVIDSLPRPGNYYIGTLVVDGRRPGERPVYETIDGQQRLTTLALLTAYLKKEQRESVPWYSRLPIHFESREHSRLTFEAIFEGHFHADPAESLDERHANTAILNGYRLIRKILPSKLRENSPAGQALTLRAFADYLFDRVRIMRVQVPAGTDLNRYFEIMNNRGEQLEKHEVLKALLMAKFSGSGDAEQENNRNCLRVVWDACANMERYVQMGFTPAQRQKLFTPDGDLRGTMDFDTLRDALAGAGGGGSGQGHESSLDELIAAAGSGGAEQRKPDEPSERFSTVINFPNFLLHVLRVQSVGEVPLDDKRLIETFKAALGEGGDAVSVVMAFAVNLLRCKYLYDHYVIKREVVKETGRWSLKRFQWNAASPDDKSSYGYANTFGVEEENTGDQRRILMLLSALHVSAPTAVYKYWLAAALEWLFRQPGTIRAEEYLHHLESVARAFVFDRFLAPDDGKLSYDEILRAHHGEYWVNRPRFSTVGLPERLSFGRVENNLVFNYLDYLLWRDGKAGDEKIRRSTSSPSGVRWNTTTRRTRSPARVSRRRTPTHSAISA